MFVDWKLERDQYPIVPLKEHPQWTEDFLLSLTSYRFSQTEGPTNIYPASESASPCRLPCPSYLNCITDPSLSAAAHPQAWQGPRGSSKPAVLHCDIWRRVAPSLLHASSGWASATSSRQCPLLDTQMGLLVERTVRHNEAKARFVNTGQYELAPSGWIWD